MAFWPGVSKCGDIETKLKLNEACLEIFSWAPSTVKFQSQTTECHGCVFVDRGVIKPNSSTFFIIDSSYPLSLQIDDNGKQTQVTRRFDDFGWYSLQYHGKKGLIVQVVKDPEYFWINLLIIFALFVILVGFVKGMQFVQKRQWISRLINGNAPFQELETESNQVVSNDRTRRLGRVAAIDVFRGIAISLMIFVNYGGGQYAFFKHAPWNGLTIADVVFPFFVWIMGASTVISLRSQLRASISRLKIFKKTVIRSIFLICLGLLLNSGKHTSVGLRLPGVLQRIGFTYFIVATVEIFLSKPQRIELYGPWNMCVELADSLFQWGVVALFAVVHVSITFCLPVPGCPNGYIGPGGLSNDSDHPNCTGGAAGYIDRLILSPEHLYPRPTSQKIYKSNVPYDPEGILGILTSVVMAFLGALCGRIILSYEQNKSRIIRWLLWSVLLGVGAGGLCSFSQNDGVIPVNKNLWSLSYVLACASIAFFVFTVVYWLVDGACYWSGKPFVFAGMNSIAMYLGHEILNKQLPWRWTPFTETHFEILAMDVAASTLWIFISYLLYRKNVFISL